MRNKASTLRTLLGAFLVAGAVGAACSSQQRHSDTTVAQAPLGETHESQLPSNNSAAPPDAAEAPSRPLEPAIPLSSPPRQPGMTAPPAPATPYPSPNEMPAPNGTPPNPGTPAPSNVPPAGTPQNPNTPPPTPASPNAPAPTPAPNPIPPTGGGPTTSTESGGGGATTGTSMTVLPAAFDQQAEPFQVFGDAGIGGAGGAVPRPVDAGMPTIPAPIADAAVAGGSRGPVRVDGGSIYVPQHDAGVGRP